MAERLPEAWVLGPRDPEIPAWTVVAKEATAAAAPAGYVFQTRDFMQVPGYAGTPPNLLVVLGRDAAIRDVSLVHHNEPVFVDGLGPEPLSAFLAQYAGKSLRGGVRIAGDRGVPAGSAEIDGVSKATVSVRVIHRAVIGSALEVARHRLKDPALAGAARIRTDFAEAADWRRLESEGWVGRLSVGAADLALAFLGDGVGPSAPGGDGTFVDLRFAYLNAPTIGRALLGDEGYARLRAALAPGEHAIGVLASGGYSFPDGDILPGSAAERLSVRQNGVRVPLGPLASTFTPPPDRVPPHDEFHVLVIDGRADFDPSRPWELSLEVVRTGADRGRAAVRRSFESGYRLPARFFTVPERQDPGNWLPVWRQRAPEIAIVALAMLALGIALLAQRWTTARNGPFRVFRWGFLAFTLLFLGWQANGQLSVLNLVAAAQGLRGALDLSAYLYAPVTLLVWGFVLATAFLWGRATYCGWLCPFGALQEFAAWLGARMRLPQIKLRESVDRRLASLKYAILAAILGAALISAETAEWLAELEPFKTAIGLAFRRTWPFVLYAVLLLALSAVAFKAFCRYLCPLGAALALIGKARRWNWLERRADCGKPCQLCRHRCRYKAIERSGAIRYDECFQCMDCVVIHGDRGKCAPLMLADKRLRRALGRAGAR